MQPVFGLVDDLAIVAALVFGWGTLSARLERFDVTAPITFVLAGLLLTHGPLAFFKPGQFTHRRVRNPWRAGGRIRSRHTINGIRTRAGKAFLAHGSQEYQNSVAIPASDAPPKCRVSGGRRDTLRGRKMPWLT